MTWVGNFRVNLSISCFFWATTFAIVCVSSSGVCPSRSQFGFWAATRLARLLSAAGSGSLLAAVIRTEKKGIHVNYGCFQPFLNIQVVNKGQPAAVQAEVPCKFTVFLCTTILWRIGALLKGSLAKCNEKKIFLFCQHRNIKGCTTMPYQAIYTWGVTVRTIHV